MLAGTAKVEITCREEGAPAYHLTEKTREHIPPHLWDKKIEIDDPLYLKALVLDDGARRHVLITMDVTAICTRTITQDILGDSADNFLSELRKRLSAELGIPGECVTVAASHTHPPGRLLCSDAEQIERAVRAVRQAVAGMVPVRAGAASATQDKLTFNRTLMMKDGTDYTIRGCNPLPPDDEVEALRPIDPEVGVLRFDRLDGSPMALVYNFGSHLLIGSPFSNISADFPGTTSGFLEATLGHDAMAFFLQGAGGDVSEIIQLDREHPRWGPAFGVALGQSVLEAFRRANPSDCDLRLISETVSFPLRSDLPAAIERLRREQRHLVASLRYTNLDFKTFLPLYLKHTLHPDFPLHSAYRYLHAEQSGDPGYRVLAQRNTNAVRKYLESLRTMEKLARNEEKIGTMQKQQEVIEAIGGCHIEAEIQGLRIGDCAVVTAPMEILAETALELKTRSPFPHTYIASITNGYLHYAPPASYYSRGGYESTECLLGPGWQVVYETSIARILSGLISMQRDER